MRTIADADRRRWERCSWRRGKGANHATDYTRHNGWVRRACSLPGGSGRRAPLGDAAWGGAHTQLTTGQRVGSGVAVFVYLAAIYIVRGCAAGGRERLYRWGTWAFVGILGLAAVANVASESPWESYLLAPVAILLAALCFVVARTAARGEGARQRAFNSPPRPHLPT
jgi:hypothetical protein